MFTRSYVELVDRSIPIEKGGEEYLGPFKLESGSDLRVDCSGTVKFYAGVFDDAYYQRARTKGGMFPFPFGSDRPSYARTLPVTAWGTYWLVLRVGVFTPGGSIRVRVSMTGPPVPVTPSAAPARAAGPRPSRLVSWASDLASSPRLWGSVVLAVVAVDLAIGLLRPLGDLLAALEAEGTLSLAAMTYLSLRRGHSVV